MEKSMSMDVDGLFTAGIACHASVLAADLGLFDRLQCGSLGTDEIRERIAADWTVVSGMLDALVCAGVLEREHGRCSLSSLGCAVAEQAAVFQLWFGAYGGLLAEQKAMATGGQARFHRAVKGEVVARASARIGARLIDPTLLKIVDRLAPAGAICDLGCGTGERLLELCRVFGVAGLGFDRDPGAVQAAERACRAADALGIEARIQRADVTALHGRWPGVDILIQAFMTHHVTPDEACVAMLAGYRARFPASRYLLLLDTVTADAPQRPCTFAPGFDYIHRLRGWAPRTRSAAHRVFAAAGCQLHEEIELDVPNSYAWVLSLPEAGDGTDEPVVGGVPSLA